MLHEKTTQKFPSFWFFFLFHLMLQNLWWALRAYILSLIKCHCRCLRFSFFCCCSSYTWWSIHHNEMKILLKAVENNENEWCNEGYASTIYSHCCSPSHQHSLPRSHRSSYKIISNIIQKTDEWRSFKQRQQQQQQQCRKSFT